ncbi:MAG: hypothetical protein ACP5JG_10945 [Anaerolineae bacterium]
MGELTLRRKWTLRAHGQRVVFAKRQYERTEHVVMKALLWALYLPDYPDLKVEIHIGDRYKPDVVSLDPWRRPRFWGEAGRISPDKIETLVKRYRAAHFAIAKWDTPLAPFVEIVGESLADLERTAPFDLIRVPPDAAERFIDERGEIRVTLEDLIWRRFEGAEL